MASSGGSPITRLDVTPPFADDAADVDAALLIGVEAVLAHNVGKRSRRPCRPGRPVRANRGVSPSASEQLRTIFRRAENEEPPWKRPQEGSMANTFEFQFGLIDQFGKDCDDYLQCIEETCARPEGQGLFWFNRDVLLSRHATLVLASAPNGRGEWRFAGGLQASLYVENGLIGALEESCRPGPGPSCARRSALAPLDCARCSAGLPTQRLSARSPTRRAPLRRRSSSRWIKPKSCFAPRVLRKAYTKSRGRQLMTRGVIARS